MLNKALRHSPILFIALLLPTLACGAEFSAEGFGESEAEARKNAQATLAESLYVDIRSEYTGKQDNTGLNEATITITSSSRIPLLGVTTSLSRTGNSYHAVCSLNTTTSLTLYQSSLRELVAAINQRAAQQSKIDRTVRHRLLEELLSSIDQLQRVKTVARLLGDTTDYKIATSRDQVVAQLQQLEARTPTLQLAAANLATALPDAAIYVFPPHPKGSREISQLSRLLRDAIAAKIPHRVADPAQAKFNYRGEYEILADSIYVSYQLVDTSGNVTLTNTSMLAPEAYDKIVYRPQHTDFDQLLHEGYVQDKTFRAALATNRGSEDLLFQQGESVRLYAKLNRPGYFYIVGHATNDSDTYSYLLELGEGMDKRKFVNYVNADDVNKWIELGEFEVSPPFGIESLQMIAANKDLVNNVPDAVWDDKSQLFIVSHNSTEAISKTRALKLKKDQTGERQLAETVLMLTTSP